MTQWNQAYLPVLKALGDVNRLTILQMLSQEEVCACRLLDCLDMSQSTLSHHMKLLCDSGMVLPRKEGKWVRYSINEKKAEELSAFFAEMAEMVKKKEVPGFVPKGLPGHGGKIQLYVLTGFLGSGKTTILTKLLQELQDRSVGVIQNEIGQLSIDSAILCSKHRKTVELNCGSIFCSCMEPSFVKALEEMATQQLDYLFVESSGWEAPSNMEEVMNAMNGALAEQYEYRGIICMVDGENFFSQLKEKETVQRQLRHCNMAVITKVDFVDAGELEQIRQKIREINPVCKVALSAKGNLDRSFLSQNLMSHAVPLPEESIHSPEAKPKTLVLECGEAVAEEVLTEFLQDILPEAYRIKGFFKVKRLGWQQIDAVGQRIIFSPCTPKEKSQLVFISKIGPEIVRSISEQWKQHTDVPIQLKN